MIAIVIIIVVTIVICIWLIKGIGYYTEEADAMERTAKSSSDFYLVEKYRKTSAQLTVVLIAVIIGAIALIVMVG